MVDDEGRLKVGGGGMADDVVEGDNGRALIKSMAQFQGCWGVAGAKVVR